MSTGIPSQRTKIEAQFARLIVCLSGKASFDALRTAIANDARLTAEEKQLGLSLTYQAEDFASND